MPEVGKLELRAEVSWDPLASLASFSGPGGFTQIPMSQREARGIADALRIPFFVAKPGTTVRP